MDATVSFTSNLQVQQKAGPDADDLFVWPFPDMFGKNEYGVSLVIESIIDGDNADVTRRNIRVDQHGNCIRDDPVFKKTLEEHREQVDELFRLAKEEWDLP